MLIIFLVPLQEDIAQGVQASLVDASTSVREAAIDLVGRFILLKPDLVKQYYEMLTARILVISPCAATDACGSGLDCNPASIRYRRAPTYFVEWLCLAPVLDFSRGLWSWLRLLTRCRQENSE